MSKEQEFADDKCITYLSVDQSDPLEIQLFFLLEQLFI